MKRFTAVIDKLGVNPFVEPPADVLDRLFLQAARSKGPISVCGSIGGAEFVQTLVKYAGRWRLYVNGQMLKASGLKVGDTAEIAIEYDARPREVPMLEALRGALASDPAVATAFEALAPSRRKEILRYLDSVKSESSRQRNIEKVIRQLRADKS